MASKYSLVSLVEKFSNIFAYHVQLFSASKPLFVKHLADKLPFVQTTMSFLDSPVHKLQHITGSIND